MSNNKYFRSIRYKLVFILSISALLATLLSSVVQFWYIYDHNKDNEIKILSQTASILGENLNASLEFDDADSAKVILSALRLSESIDAGYLLKDKKQIFASYVRDGVDERHLNQTISFLYEKNNIKSNIEFSNFDNLIISKVIYIEDKYLASFVIISNTKHMYSVLKTQLIRQVLISIVVLLIIIFFAFKIQGVFTLPIFSLKRAMDDVRKNANYDAKINFHSNDEFQSLFDGFYKMIDTIKWQQEEQKIAQQEISYQKEFDQTLLDSQEQMIITTNGLSLLSANKAFFDFYLTDSIDNFFQKYEVKCICETFKVDAPDGYLQISMDGEKWIDYIISRYDSDTVHKVMINREGTDFVFSVTGAKLPGNKDIKSAVFTNITAIELAKQEVDQILKNILLPVVITSQKNRTILYANKHAATQYEMPIDKMIGSSITEVYTIEGQQNHIIEALKREEVIENLEEVLKTSKGKIFTALLSVAVLFYKNEPCFITMMTDITQQKSMENEIRAINTKTRESIEYASLIQGALIPDKHIFEKYFEDYFAIWHPKDIVGGDIYLMHEINENELVLMLIDCTGHGVPGAFVSMLVKAVERQIMSNIHKDETISPAKILCIFNRSIKHLLKQENIDSISNAGFDGGILYYNKKEKIIKFSGAETSLFYLKNDDVEIIKGSRHSVGYKKSDPDFQFKEHTITCSQGMKFYLTTDGYLDQNGGKKGFPFGKKRFTQLIHENANKSFTDQQELFLYELQKYQNNFERNDDVTLIGFSIADVDMTLECEKREATIILNYQGVITHNFISTCIDNIESEVTNFSMKANISTVVIELCQNLINYSKTKDKGCRIIEPTGFIEILKENEYSYKIISTNIVSIDDKNVIEPKLVEIQSLDREGIKKRYKELRSSGKDKHEKGAGIGLYEIAKRVNKLAYNFKAINIDKYEYTITLKIESKQKVK